MSVKTLIVIAGPTAIGKTALAVKVAKHFQAEILSADSRQFYREMNIGTAKPSVDELAEVKHHFINSSSITDSVTVGDFEKAGLSVLENLFKTNEIAVLVGGSGLFVQAICKGFDDLPSIAPGIRESLNKELEELGLECLQNKLKDVDPIYYSEMDISNPQRVIRALEVFISTNKPFSSFRQQNLSTRPFNVIKIGLNTAREFLYNRINERVDSMMQAGLLDEVKSLKEFQHLNALNTVGYAELFLYLNGELTLEQAVSLIKQNTRRFAKRQLTWFRKDTNLVWFEPDATQLITYLQQKILL